MSAVTVQEIINQLRSGNHHLYLSAMADRIEQHGIAPPDIDANGCSTHPKARHGFARQASHSEGEYVCECAGFDPYDAGYQDGIRAAWDANGTLLPDGWVLVKAKPVAWRHWHPIECDFEYSLKPVCNRCDALYIAAAPEVSNEP